MNELKRRIAFPFPGTHHPQITAINEAGTSPNMYSDKTPRLALMVALIVAPNVSNLSAFKNIESSFQGLSLCSTKEAIMAPRALPSEISTAVWKFAPKYKFEIKDAKATLGQSLISMKTSATSAAPAGSQSIATPSSLADNLRLSIPRAKLTTR